MGGHACRPRLKLRNKCSKPDLRLPETRVYLRPGLIVGHAGQAPVTDDQEGPHLVNATVSLPADKQAAIKGLSKKVLPYFREFLETDFKRQNAPRRRIQLKTQAGYRSAIDLRKYSAFFKDVWSLAAKPPREMKLTLGHKGMRADKDPLTIRRERPA